MGVRRWAGLTAVFVAAGLSAGCFIDGAGLGARESVTATRSLDADGSFVLKNVNGRVSVDTWKETRVRIEADKAAARRSLLDEIRIEISGEGRRVTVETHSPHRLFGGGTEVRYHVTVPVGAHVEVETVNGRIEVEGVAGAVVARTTNGSVDVDSDAQSVSARSTNGSIHATLHSTTAGRLDLETVNGSVHLALPRDARGRFEAETVNGGIHSDLPFSVQGKWGPKHLSGQVGEGGGEYRIRTVNGSVDIDRV